MEKRIKRQIFLVQKTFEIHAYEESSSTWKTCITKTIRVAFENIVHQNKLLLLIPFP